MNGTGKATRMLCILAILGLFMIDGNAMAAAARDIVIPTKKGAQLKIEEKETQARESKEKKFVVKESDAELEAIIAELAFPEDTSPKLAVTEVRITGNTLIGTDKLLAGVPAVFSASDVPLKEAASRDLFDFRVLQEVISQPGRARQLSSRTIQGFAQYIISAYRAEDYAGIYAYVPKEALEGNRLRDDVLLINVIEAVVDSVTTSYFTADNKSVEKGYLKSSTLLKWSPVKEGEVANERELNEMVNLLNLNPDRYISPVISSGARKNTLALNYNIYEANPWHFFVQADNSGTEDRQWSPRVGLINTNLTGIDDRLTVYYQAPWEKGIEDRFSIFGSYDFPIMGPRLRLNLFAAYSEFEIDGGGGIDWLGNGSVHGGTLRYNAFQEGEWFFDVTTSLTQEKSRVTTTLAASALGSKVEMDLWGAGINLYRRNDMKNTFFAFDRVETVDASSDARFDQARSGADNEFTIYTATANHSQYLDVAKVQRLSGSFRWINPGERMVPAKMTTFGGMYSIRGYEESKIVADGGILASVQYEYDLVKSGQTGERSKTGSDKRRLKKLAPLVFFDYGRAKTEDHVSGEKGDEDLYSIGIGGLVEFGDNFSGAVYYGYPLDSTDTTDEGDGRLNVSVMMRW